MVQSQYPELDSDQIAEFTPVASIIGFIFIGVNFLILAIIKTYYLSSDQYNIQNRFDLVIFKTPQKNGKKLGARSIYKNSKASMHNLNAAAACGFDLSKLNIDKFSPVLSGQNMPDNRSINIQEFPKGSASMTDFSETPLEQKNDHK